MRHFILTSTSFTGSLEYKYCDNGYLIWFQYNALASDSQRNWLLSNMPLTVSGFNEVVSKAKSFKVEEIQLDLSFDAFWEQYGHKINKKRCLPLYNKLSTEKRMQCIKSIVPYKRYLARTNYRNKTDPENYLRKEMYLNDWNKL